MDILAIDFETYYDSEHSIGEMCMAKYIFGKKAQVIMMSYKLNDDPVQCAIGEEEVANVLKGFDFSKVALCSHNGHFDNKILRDKFGIASPKLYLDTMGMMAATGGNVIVNGNGLDEVAKLLQGAGIDVPTKGEERSKAKGKRLFRFPDGRWYMHEEEINDAYIASYQAKNYTKKGLLKKGKKDLVTVARDAIQFFNDYKDYCMTDTEICYQAAKYFIPLLPKEEIKFQDMMMRCYVEPELVLDKDVLLKEKRRLDKRRLEKIRPVANKYLNGDLEAAKEYLRSKGKFAILLKSLGGVTDQDVFDANSKGEDLDYAFIIPTKVSEKTGKVDYAFSLTDEGFMRLSEVSPELKEICDARKEMASSIEHSRTDRFIENAEWETKFGLAYKISGAATHRLSGGAGGTKMNAQNLSSGRKEGQTTALRDSIMSPDNQHTLVVADSSQVELRGVAYIANEPVLLDAFRAGQDVYSITASGIYHVPWDEINRGRKAGDETMGRYRIVGKVTSLGGIYGIGAMAFRDYAVVTAGVELTMQESEDIIKSFRSTYPALPKLWRECTKVLGHMLAGGSGYFGGLDGKLFYYDGNYQIHGKTVPSIIGPDGMRLSYYKLCKRAKTYDDGSVRENYAYWGYKEGRYQWVYIHGAKLVENCTQYLAFAVMKYQGLLINQRAKILLNTHDEWGVLARDTHLTETVAYVEQCMRTVPPWAPNLPLDCESATSRRYGEC